MKPFGIILIALGLLLLLGYWVANRRLKMKMEDGDEKLDKLTAEVARNYGVPKTAAELTPEKLHRLLNTALALVAIGAILLCYAKN